MATLKEQYLAPEWQQWLAKNRLDNFQAWWQLDLADVDSPNRDRGGWSRVGVYEHAGKKFYVKRQKNHMTRNFASPLRRVPTLKAEHIKINWYKDAKIPALDVVFFAWQKNKNDNDAILVTEALSEYDSLRAWVEERHLNPKQKMGAAKGVGEAVAGLHRAGIQHHNLYPKHVYLKPQKDGCWSVRFIDLETSRPHFGLMMLKLRDLDALERRAPGSRTDRLRVFLAYLGKKRLDPQAKKLALRIIRRREDKNSRP